MLAFTDYYNTGDAGTIKHECNTTINLLTTLCDSTGLYQAYVQAYVLLQGDTLQMWAKPLLPGIFHYNNEKNETFTLAKKIKVFLIPVDQSEGA